MISLGPAVHLLTNISPILLALVLLHTTARGGVAGVAEHTYLVTRVVNGDTIVVPSRSISWRGSRFPTGRS